MLHSTRVLEVIEYDASWMRIVKVLRDYDDFKGDGTTPIAKSVFFVTIYLVVDHATETRVACFMLVHVRQHFQDSKIA